MNGWIRLGTCESVNGDRSSHFCPRCQRRR
ncbi:MAG: hypothetical protein D3X82_05085 [Candidatus Leucobacter sulfamidivorax]|nr:hypothetical protein [Candidatus Leucobacter sulfamidivorax]